MPSVLGVVGKGITSTPEGENFPFSFLITMTTMLLQYINCQKVAARVYSRRLQSS